MFISRSEIEFLETKFEKAFQDGTGSTILISGEAGIGKTFLIKDFIEKKTRENKYNKFLKVLSASGFCLNMDGESRSLYPWKDVFIDLDTNLVSLNQSDYQDEKAKIKYKKIVRSIYDGQGAEWIKLIPVVGNYASVLFKTVKDVSKEVSAQKAAAHILKMSQNVYIQNQDDVFIQVMSQLRKLAEKYVLIVFLDDIQWFDLSSRDLFFYLAKNLADKSYRILLIGSYRPDDINKKINPVTGNLDKHLLDEMFVNLQRFNAYYEVSLGRLSEGQIKEFVNLRFPDNKFSEEFIIQLEHLTQGNVLFLQETLNNFWEKKYIFHDGIYKNIENIDYSEVPKTIAGVIQERFERLPDDFQQILQIASVMGEVFSVEIIMSILEQSQINFFRKIEKLKNQHRIIDKANEIYHKLTMIYHFTHNLVQKYIYFNIENEFRIEYHKLISLTIRNFFEGESIKKVSEQYSFHLGVGFRIIDSMCKVILKKEILDDAESVNKVEEFLEFTKVLVSEYERNYCYKEAVKRCETVIGISQILNKTEDEIDYTLKKGVLLSSIGKWNDAEIAYNNSLILSNKVGDKFSIAKNKELMSTIFRSRGEYEKATLYLKESIYLYEELNDKFGIANSLGSIGDIYLIKGNYKEAVKNYMKALNIFEELSDKIGIATIFLNIGNIHFYSGDFSKAETYYDKALKISESIGDKKIVSVIELNLGNMESEKGNYAEAKIYYDLALKISEELNDIEGIAFNISNLGATHYRLGEIQKAEIAFYKALKIYEELGNKKGIANGIKGIGLIFKEKGDYENAMKYYSDALLIFEQLDNRLETAITLSNISEINIEKLDFEDAAKNLDRAIEIGKEIKAKFYLCLFLYKKALLLFYNKKYDESLNVNKIAYETAKEVQRNEVIFYCDILLAKLFSITDKEKGLDIFQNMLKEFTDEFHIAELNYEIYHLNNSDEYKSKALSIYIKLNEKSRRNEYRKKITELSR